MPLHFLPLALTVIVVVVLGIGAIIGSTSGGAQWLQSLGKRGAATPETDEADRDEHPAAVPAPDDPDGR